MSARDDVITAVLGGFEQSSNESISAIDIALIEFYRKGNDNKAALSEELLNIIEEKINTLSATTAEGDAATPSPSLTTLNALKTAINNLIAVRKNNSDAYLDEIFEANEALLAAIGAAEETNADNNSLFTQNDTQFQALKEMSETIRVNLEKIEVLRDSHALASRLVSGKILDENGKIVDITLAGGGVAEASKVAELFNQMHAKTEAENKQGTLFLVTAVACVGAVICGVGFAVTSLPIALIAAGIAGLVGAAAYIAAKSQEKDLPNAETLTKDITKNITEAVATARGRIAAVPA